MSILSDLIDFILGKKKTERETVQKIPEIKEEKREISAEKPEVIVTTQPTQAVQLEAPKEAVAIKSVVVREEPIITVARDISEIKYLIEDIKRSTYEDHHRIIKDIEELPKKSDFSDILTQKLVELQSREEEIRKEIETTELQKEILEVLKSGELSAAEIAERLEKSRTWVSLQISQLLSSNMIETKKEGKFVKYALKKEGEPIPEELKEEIT